MCNLTITMLLAGVVTGFCGWRLWKRRRIWRIAAAILLLVSAFLLIASGGYSYWYHHRSQGEPAVTVLFDGITYERDVRKSPRPLVIHVVTVNLDSPKIGFFVTPGEPIAGRQLPASTTSQFLRRFAVQVAINANFFHPWYAKGPLAYYPHVGDPVDVTGLAVSQEKPYSQPKETFATLYLTADNRASIGKPLENTFNAISGRPLVLSDGKVIESIDKPGSPTLHPRTAVALDKTRRKMLLFVIDGRQPNYSEGVTLKELAEITAEYGADVALNLDGGGSSTLVIEGPDGEPTVLNSPIHGRIPPGRERPVANHLGIFARRAN